MHIAAAMRVPTLGLFGSSNDVEYRPWGPTATFVRGAPFRGKSEPKLIEALPVDAVVAAAQKLLA
jgi:ADP-heptose:LPS heptosyltransferase